jgi:hypothetical protein
MQDFLEEGDTLPHFGQKSSVLRPIFLYGVIIFDIFAEQLALVREPHFALFPRHEVAILASLYILFHQDPAGKRGQGLLIFPWASIAFLSSSSSTFLIIFITTYPVTIQMVDYMVLYGNRQGSIENPVSGKTSLSFR